MSQNIPERENKRIQATETRGLDSFQVGEPERFDPVQSVGPDAIADIDD